MALRLQSLIPSAFIITAIMLTLILAWVMYSQIVVIRLARVRLRSKPA